jgi:hypothetical protein
VAILENQQSAITPEVWLDQLKIYIIVIGTSSEDTLHNVWLFYFTYFSRSQRSKFKISMLAHFPCMNMYLGIIPNFGLFRHQIWLPDGLENKLCAITSDLMAGLSPNFNYWYIKIYSQHKVSHVAPKHMSLDHYIVLLSGAGMSSW